MTRAAELGAGLAWRALSPPGGVHDLMMLGRCATAASLARQLLERCKDQGSDPLRVLFLSSLVVEAGAHAGDWDPWEAQGLLEEAEAALEASNVNNWGDWSFCSHILQFTPLNALAAAGGRVATASFFDCIARVSKNDLQTNSSMV